MATAYPELVRRLQQRLTEYRAKRTSVSDLQAAIGCTAEALVSLEDRELRSCLLWAEGRLDTLQSTTERSDLFAASLEVVSAVEDGVRKALSA